MLSRRALLACVLVSLVPSLIACRDTVVPAKPVPGLIHLTRELDRAEVVAGNPDGAAIERSWTFETPRPEWAPVDTELASALATVEREQLDDAMRLTLQPPAQPRGPLRMGGLAVALEELRFEDWEAVHVKARSADRLAGVTVSYNLEEAGALPRPERFYLSPDEAPPIFNDGSVQTYAIPLRPHRRPEDQAAPSRPAKPSETFHSLAVVFASPGPARVDVLSITLVPRGSAFQGSHGALAVTRGGTTRDALWARTPAAISFPVEGSAGGRLDLGLTTSPGEATTYRVRSAASSEPLLEETIDDASRWHQRTVDLAGLAEPASSARLILEAESERPGAVALWGAPIVSGVRSEIAPARPTRPNVIFYVIDGGGADLMSLYGYERPTTPFLEELASEGVLFTRGYSNSTWTQPSTVSFMTSLQHSVLGGLRRGMHSTAVPKGATTMAEHFRAGGYQTASYTANPNAGRLIGIDRGVDELRDVETEHHSTSSFELHEHYWRFRENYPGGPTWVHFQTTDVHEPNEPQGRYAERFVSAEERRQLAAWDGKRWSASVGAFGHTSVAGFYELGLERAGIDRRAYYSIRKGLYDETMVHQDDALRSLVAALKQRGEWRNTLLVIGADHGHPAGTFAPFGRGLIDPRPEPWQGALFDAWATRIPLLFIWPDRLEGGRVIDAPVSMIDVLPTLLELVNLPLPEVLQGQSLAPLLRGEAQQVRPVILDEFRIDEASGEWVGNLEMIDGKWGASLEIGPIQVSGDARRGRHSAPAGGRWGAVHPFFPEVPNLLLYDLEEDPFAASAVNHEHPELVERYRRRLLDMWQAHRALASLFTSSEATALTAEQLRQLQALGYI